MGSEQIKTDEIPEPDGSEAETTIRSVEVDYSLKKSKSEKPETDGSRHLEVDKTSFDIGKRETQDSKVPLWIRAFFILVVLIIVAGAITIFALSQQPLQLRQRLATSESENSGYRNRVAQLQQIHQEDRTITSCMQKLVQRHEELSGLEQRLLEGKDVPKFTKITGTKGKNYC